MQSKKLRDPFEPWPELEAMEVEVSSQSEDEMESD